MTHATLQQFFFWCTLVNLVIYLLGVFAWFTTRRFIVAVQRRSFGMDEAAVGKSMHYYLGAHKLVTTVFCFVPWLALVITR